MKSIKKPQLIFSLLGVVTLFFLVFLTTYAQDIFSTQTLEISPPSQEISADPGQTVTIKVRIRNLTKAMLPVKVRAEDFMAQGSDGQVALVSKSPYSISQWTTITPNTFDLGAGESKEITALIQVPKTGAAGGRYGSFVFSITPKTPEGAPQAKVAQEIASLFLVKISGPLTERVTLTEFSAPKFLEFGPVPFSMTFKNSGNIHERIAGLIHVENIFHKKTADIVLKPTNIFPGSDRTLENSLNKKFLFGPYTATALFVYGSKNESLTSSSRFIVFPVKYFGIGLLIIMLLFLARKRIKKALRALMKG